VREDSRCTSATIRQSGHGKPFQLAITALRETSASAVACISQDFSELLSVIMFRVCHDHVATNLHGLMVRVTF